MELHLKAEKREVKGKQVKKLREQGKLPVVLYGHGIAPSILSVDAKVFSKIYHEAGSSTLVKMEIDGEKEPVNILFHQVDRHPSSDEIIHADFLQVKLTEKIKAEIPIILIGDQDAPVVKEKEGSIITNISQIEVEAFPQDLVHEITVDVSALTEFDQKIHIKDLVIPKTITVLEDPEDVVISIQEPRSEEELAKLEEEVKEDVEAVEVEKKGKEDEESDGETAETKSDDSAKVEDAGKKE